MLDMNTATNVQRDAYQRALHNYFNAAATIDVIDAKLKDGSEAYLVTNRDKTLKTGIKCYHLVARNERGKWQCACEAHQHDTMRYVICVHQIAAQMRSDEREAILADARRDQAILARKTVKMSIFR